MVGTINDFAMVTLNLDIFTAADAFRLRTLYALVAIGSNFPSLVILNNSIVILLGMKPYFFLTLRALDPIFLRLTQVAEKERKRV